MYYEIIYNKRVRATIRIYLSDGVYEYPYKGSEFWIDDEDPKEFLSKQLHDVVILHLDSFQGAAVYRYVKDGDEEIPIEYIRYKINKIKYNLTKQAEFILDERIKCGGE